MYVQYGCGWSAPEQWMNFDASPTLKWERMPLLGRLYTKNPQRFPPNVKRGNIVKGLPIPECVCEGIYASHVLEHLALDDFHRALVNTKKMLKRDGIFRMVVPDLEWIAREYTRRLDAGDCDANHFFLEETGLGRKTRSNGIISFFYEWLRTSEHMWMWDARSISSALDSHGFHAVRRCSFGDCEDPMFALVENSGRFEHAIGVEARV